MELNCIYNMLPILINEDVYCGIKKVISQTDTLPSRSMWEELREVYGCEVCTGVKFCESSTMRLVDDRKAVTLKNCSKLSRKARRSGMTSLLDFSLNVV